MRKGFLLPTILAATAASAQVVPHGFWRPSAPPDLSNLQVETLNDISVRLTWTAMPGAIKYGMSVPMGTPCTGIMVDLGNVLTYDATGLTAASSQNIRICGSTDGVTYSTGMLVTAKTCPAKYVGVPANATLGTGNFCMMKYEAKNVSSVATSQVASSPWVNIARGATSATAGSAWKACKDLGADYDLATNAEWQAIGRSIENVPANWSNGIVGGATADSINRGNSNGSSGLAADANDANGCAGISGPPANCSWHVNKRTHALGNGQVIWDIAANVWEWARDNNSVSPGTAAYVSQLTSPTYDLAKWGAGGNYTAKNSGEYGGLGYVYPGTSGAVGRGGAWTYSTQAGIYTSQTNATTSYTNGGNGFRCAYYPP